jgi:cell division protein FtsB
MNKFTHVVAAALATSALVFSAGFMYEGYKTRAVVAVKMEALTDQVKALAARVQELERAKK